MDLCLRVNTPMRGADAARFSKEVSRRDPCERYGTAYNFEEAYMVKSTALAKVHACVPLEVGAGSETGACWWNVGTRERLEFPSLIK